MSLNDPAPPVIDLGFFFAEQSDSEAFFAVARALEDIGARLTGSVSVHEGDDSVAPFCGPSDYERIEKRVAGLADVERLDSAADRRVVSCDLSISLVGETSEPLIVTYGRIGDSGCESRHPIQVWLSGDEVDFYCRDTTYLKGRRAAEAIKDLFRSLVLALNPSYGAISCLRPLSTPLGFLNDTVGGGDFYDYFVDGSYVGEKALGKIRRDLAGEIELVGDGLLVSASSNLCAGDRVKCGNAANLLSASVRGAVYLG